MKKVVFVLGMGRSGTSALTRVLSLRGAALPELLLDAHESNPAGHWEPLAALRLNDAFLARHGSDWYDPSLRLQEVSLDAGERESFIGAIVAFFETCPAAPLLAIKDPRISAVAAYWIEAAKRAGYDAVAAVAIRHPVEVAASLSARNRSSAELGYLLWLKYNLLAESASRLLPRVFVDYQALLWNWRTEASRVDRLLELDSQPSHDEAIDAFLQPALHRQRASEIIDAAVVSPYVERLYRHLWLAARDGPLDVGAIDALFAEYRLYERFFRIASDDYVTRFQPSIPARTQSTDGLDDRMKLHIVQAEKISAEGFVFIDDITIDGNAVGEPIIIEPEHHLTIRGWAVDQQARDVATAVYAVAGDRVFGAAYGFARSDVVETFGNVRYLQSGYRFDLAMDDLPQGTTTLRIGMVGAGRVRVYEVESSIEITVKSQADEALDAPTHRSNGA